MLKIIFKNIILLFSVLVVCTGNAQKFYLETGFSSAYFKDYRNNLGKNTLDLSYSKSKSPFFEAGYKQYIFTERSQNTVDFLIDKLEFDVGINYSTYKINTGFISQNTSTPVTYDLSYIALKSGLNLSVIDWERLTLQLHFHFSYDWLTKGSYNYENKVVDIFKDKTLDRTLFRYHRGANLQYAISDQISIYLNYNMASSFRERSKDSSSGESYIFRTNSSSIGLIFNIKDTRG